MGSPNKAPWPDFAGNEIHAGDVIRHPGGEQGTVVFLAEESESGDQWRVRYDDGPLSRLVLQIGDKGMAVVVHHMLRSATDTQAKSDVPNQTCGNCKHWTRYPPPIRGTLASQDPDWEKQGECSALSCFVDCCGCGGGFDPKEDFSCNKWEPKP